MNELQLIFDLRSGDQNAFDQIYALYSRRLMAYVVRYVKSAEDAQEIVQDVFVSLWTHRDTVRSSDTVSSLLFTIARNKILNMWRSNVNSPVYEDYMDYCERLGEQPRSGVEYDEFRSSVDRAMRTLSHTQRRIITMSRFDGMTHREIASELNLSEQTIRNQLSLGLSRLREILPKAMMGLAAVFLFD